MATAYPLAWPAGWPRTSPTKREGGAKFKGGPTAVADSNVEGGYRWVGRREVTFDRARELLAREIERLGARDVVLSTNVPLRIDGQPHAGSAKARLEDPGIALYFTYKGKQMVMACDRFERIAANMRSLGLAIEAMRQLERHGGGVMMERAFAGFAAIEGPRDWRRVLGWDHKNDLPTADMIEQRFRTLAKQRHPDTGGSETAMAELNAAREAALEAVGHG